LKGGEFFKPCYVRPGYALAPAVTNSYRTPYTPPYLLRRIQKGRDDRRRRADRLLGLARIQSTRDSCRTQVAGLYCFGWCERIPRPDTAPYGTGRL